jgi:hypothetical protein
VRLARADPGYAHDPREVDHFTLVPSSAKRLKLHAARTSSVQTLRGSPAARVHNRLAGLTARQAIGALLSVTRTSEHMDPTSSQLGPMDMTLLATAWTASCSWRVVAAAQNLCDVVPAKVMLSGAPTAMLEHPGKPVRAGLTVLASLNGCRPADTTRL